MLVVELLSEIAIVRLANLKRFGCGFRLRTIALTASLVLVLSTIIGCGALSSSSTSAPAGTPPSGSSGPGNGGSATTASSVSKVAVNPTSVTAGASTTATVTLNAVAPASGAQVKLTSSNAAAASVPASVTVAASQTSVGFAVATGNVSSDTSVVITASYKNTSAGTTLSVSPPAPSPTPNPAPISISISPASATLSAGASQQFTATVAGTTNQSVSWTAAGGTITNSGLFAAPNVSSSTIAMVYATSQADPSIVEAAQVTVTPASTPPPPGTYSGTGPVASWQAYLYLDTDNLYHQAIEISNAQAAYPVIGYSYAGPGCTNLGDTFNDFWQPIGNGLWWFIHDPSLVEVTWVWYDNATDQKILQQTPCVDYSGAPKYN